MKIFIQNTIFKLIWKISSSTEISYRENTTLEYSSTNSIPSDSVIFNTVSYGSLYCVTLLNLNLGQFAELRNESSVLLRHLTTFQPATTMSVVEEWLKELLVKPINTGSGK